MDVSLKHLKRQFRLWWEQRHKAAAAARNAAEQSRAVSAATPRRRERRPRRLRARRGRADTGGARRRRSRRMRLRRHSFTGHTRWRTSSPVRQQRDEAPPAPLAFPSRRRLRLKLRPQRVAGASWRWRRSAPRKANVPGVSAISAAERASLLPTRAVRQGTGRGRRCPRRRARSGWEGLREGRWRRHGGDGEDRNPALVGGGTFKFF